MHGTRTLTALKNSAKLAAKHRLKIPAVMRPHMTALGPPEGKLRLKEADRAVHVFWIVKSVYECLAPVS